ncbi:hypothetical protein BDK51DRAFT_40516 [Blyttiomyces helicus]|uniref:Uncharacterized protein n=1 Tax=Blyttiomyces helicus TaxID=388810 RepID=A0A4P9W7X1_9FUNG|nr:hypothetical protein BDK51DRAFT_40516 [Blyttiomyces helicus]|eukprot:RKO88589.1 hypothetical protein BDK51DRAFT_40516 [Blyttiomyces helicus]
MPAPPADPGSDIDASRTALLALHQGRERLPSVESKVHEGGNQAQEGGEGAEAKKKALEAEALGIAMAREKAKKQEEKGKEDSESCRGWTDDKTLELLDMVKLLKEQQLELNISKHGFEGWAPYFEAESAEVKLNYNLLKDLEFHMSNNWYNNIGTSNKVGSVYDADLQLHTNNNALSGENCLGTGSEYGDMDDELCLYPSCSESPAP